MDSEKHLQANYSQKLSASIQICNNLRLNQRQLLTYRELVQKGFDQATAIFILDSSQLNTYNEILYYISTDSSGRINHQFLSSGDEINSQNQCLICGLHLNAHAQTYDDVGHGYGLYIKIKQQYESLIQQMIVVEENQQNRFHCSICYNLFKESELVFLQNQRHSTCKQCFKSYLQSCLGKRYCIQMITCPDCNCIIDKKDLKNFLTAAEYQQYQYFLFQNFVILNPSLRYCPYPGCENVIQIGQQADAQELRCKKCENLICKFCFRLDHPMSRCADKANEEAQELENEEEIQRCPKCKTLVQKMSGCNMMTCSICTYEWCWLCQKELTPAHYFPLNPFGCPGLQAGVFQKDQGCFLLCCFKFWISILYLIFMCFCFVLSLVFVFPCFIVFSGPSMLIGYFLQQYDQEPINIYLKILIVVLLFLLGILLDPLIIAFCIILFIPSIIYGIIKYFELIDKKQQKVEQKLQVLDKKLNLDDSSSDFIELEIDSERTHNKSFQI